MESSIIYCTLLILRSLFCPLRLVPKKRGWAASLGREAAERDYPSVQCMILEFNVSLRYNGVSCFLLWKPERPGPTLRKPRGDDQDKSCESERMIE